MSRNLVICCDGTGNEFGTENSNVVKLYQTLICDHAQATYITLAYFRMIWP